jgi:hypothetical protein
VLPTKLTSIRGYGRAIVLAAALAGLMPPASAGAAAEIGATFPGADGTCGQGETILQSSSPGSPPQYAAPSAGVITSWSFHASPIPPSVLKFKVARPSGGNLFTIIGESPPKVPAGGVLNTYTDVQIPVQPGDVIGFYSEAADEAECFRSAEGFGFHSAGGDQPPASTPTGYIPGGVSLQMSLSAVLEPDCDGDDLGDETQDPNLSACHPRTLTLDANKNKVKKGKRVRLTGRIAETGSNGAACEASQTVELQRKKPSQSTFATVEQLQTDATGAFSAKQKVKKTFEYRTEVAETASCGGGLSNTEKVKVKKQK